MKKLVLGGLVLAASIAFTPLAFAQDATTHGVPKADADAACAAVVGDTVHTAAAEAAFRAAYNTTDNTDDGPASVGLSAAWQHLIYEQELHRDYLGLAGLPDGATFTCNGAVAVFPDLTPPTTPPPTTTAAPTTTVAPTTDPTTAPPTTTPAGDDKDCADFPTQAAAQAVLDADKTDPNHLDANHNGIACEGPADSAPPLPTILPVPVPDTSSPQVDVIPSAIDTGRA